MGKPMYKGLVEDIAPKSFTVIRRSIVSLVDDVSFEGELSHEGNRIIKRAWREKNNADPAKGQEIFFELADVKGGFRIVGATSVDPREQVATIPVAPVAAAAPTKADQTIDPFPKASSIHAPLDEVIKLSWRDVFGPIGRWIRDLFARGLKVRASARS